MEKHNGLTIYAAEMIRLLWEHSSDPNYSEIKAIADMEDHEDDEDVNSFDDWCLVQHLGKTLPLYGSQLI